MVWTQAKLDDIQLRVEKLCKAAREMTNAIRIVKRELPGDYLLDRMVKLVNDAILELETALDKD